MFLEATPTRAGGAKVGWARQPWLHCSWNAIPLPSRTSCLSELGLTPFLPMVPEAPACSRASFTFSSGAGWPAFTRAGPWPFLEGGEGLKERAPVSDLLPQRPLPGPGTHLSGVSRAPRARGGSQRPGAHPAHGVRPSGDGELTASPQPLLLSERPRLQSQHLTRTRSPLPPHLE